jgi:CheY-like chemotaxis protein
METARARGPRVLIVDDDPETLELLAEALETEGIAVVGRATSGEAAIELSGELRPAVVLLDVRLPGLDGFQTARKLRELDPAPSVVFLTAYEELLPGAAHEAGGFAYLVKGCSVALMRDVLVSAAGSGSPRSRSAS